MLFVRPLVSLSIHPLNGSVDALREALRVLAREDPTLTFDFDQSRIPIKISGMGEIHLGIVLDRLLREHNIQVEPGKLKIIYLETIRKQAESEAKVARQSGPRCQYGHLKLRVAPDPGKGCTF